MSGLREWLLGLMAAAMLGMVCQGLGGDDSPVLRLSTGLVLLLVLCSPVVRFDLGEVSQLLSQTRAEASAITAEADNNDALAARITEQTEAYILDKARDMGLALKVSVTVEQGAYYPYPAAVALTGRTTTAQRRSINQWLGEDLAIAEEDVTWNEEP